MKSYIVFERPLLFISIRIRGFAFVIPLAVGRFSSVLIRGNNPFCWKKCAITGAHTHVLLEFEQFEQYFHICFWNLLGPGVSLIWKNVCVCFIKLEEYFNLSLAALFQKSVYNKLFFRNCSKIFCIPLLGRSSLFPFASIQ